MASLDISQLRNVTSGAVKNAEKLNSKVYNVLGDDGKGNEQAFSIIFDKAVENIHTTNAYLSDAENEEIKWSLGQTDNTHDLSIALQCPFCIQRDHSDADLSNPYIVHYIYL